jgi:hypothetical protein
MLGHLDVKVHLNVALGAPRCPEIDKIYMTFFVMQIKRLSLLVELLKVDDRLEEFTDAQVSDYIDAKVFNFF